MIFCTQLQGTEVHQLLNSDPSLFVGYNSFSSVEYSGTLYVDTELDDDYIGIVFNYQSNKRFMLVSWKQREQEYRRNVGPLAKAGLQIQMIKSSSGPSQELMDAMWKTGNTNNQVALYST